jgi:hypothetical protein
MPKLFGKDEIKAAVKQNVATALKTSKDYNQVKDLMEKGIEDIGGAYGTPDSRIRSIEDSLKHLKPLLHSNKNNIKLFQSLENAAFECRNLPTADWNGWYDTDIVHNNNKYIYEFSVLLGLIREDAGSFFEE